MQKAIAILCVLILPGAGTLAIAQTELPPPQQQQPQQSESMLSLDQLDNLVAPIALYPDPLLGQVLAASTYPLEIVEAQQWLQQNRGLQGPQLVEAARQQNWDPSVQALVAFPDAMAVLTRDIQWTTDLGNAFLAQQADVMNAVQTMRARARQNGRLQSTQQETVTTQPDPQFNNGQGAIQIQPADPQTVYVPVYNPAYVWGSPVYGAYPPLYYPPVSCGCGYGVGVFLGALFSGFLSFGGWGWGLGWLSHGLFLNGLFFHHFGFSGFGGGFGERALWAHNPAHRLGVGYPNRAVAARFGGFNERGYSARNFNERGFSGGRQQNARSYSSAGESRGFNRAGGSSYERGNFQNRGYENNRSYSNSSASRYSSPAGNSYENRGYENNRSYSNSSASRYSSPAGNNFQNRGYENNRSYSNSAANRYSSPRGNSENFRTPAQNSRNFSTSRESSRGSSQHFSSPRGSGGGHSSAPHSSSHSSHSSGKSGGSRKH